MINSYKRGEIDIVLEGAKMVESLSSNNDFEVQNIVVTAILESSDFEKISGLYMKLGKNTKILYEKWVSSL